ncbi:hypothetical protein GCM10010156_04300 [Planobispora rosea]|uniref:Uncharacterized protein n=1 Tax=Planobispora rosea TaxID=35762 RepID=A0A8J3RYT4_PLARO|nr:hypothetical protein GCM10010156_04300 [Planobispora rosea]GIH83714.1 hypothetical protein Pro02_21220 [Planobispora rosea]
MRWARNQGAAKPTRERCRISRAAEYLFAPELVVRGSILARWTPGDRDDAPRLSLESSNRAPESGVASLKDI